MKATYTLDRILQMDKATLHVIAVRYRRLIQRYSTAIACTACAICGRMMLRPLLHDECPFSLFYLSVLLTAWIAGTGPAVFAMALGSLSAAHFFLPPASSLYINDPADLLQLSIYIVVNSIAISLFYRVAWQHRLAERRLVENEALSTSLREADERKDEFLSLLAHELRNPLAPIRSSLALLDRSPGSVEVMGRVKKIIERHTNHLIRLADDLLDIARFCRGQVELQIDRLDIRTAINDALEMTESLFVEKNHRLQLLLPQEPVWVDGDRIRLAQLTANLLGNAAKYTPPGGRVTLQVEQFGDEFSLIVRDNGIGFASSEAERILEPFIQIDTTRTREYGGLGLGLTIVNRLVGLHGGQLQVQSRGPGQGSCFTVQLMVALPPEESTLLRQSTVANNGCFSQTMRNADRRGRVLIVEDNRDSGELLCEMIESEGFSARLAHDGFAALQEFTSFSPDVIVLDIGLPGMDGYEIAGRIRRLESGSRTRLIALTGWGRSTDRILSKQAGFDDHLVKPVVFSELLHHVRLAFEAVHSNIVTDGIDSCGVST